MEFRTHVKSGERGPRIDWPTSLLDAAIDRVAIVDIDGYEGTNCFTDLALENGHEFKLTISVRPLETPPTVRSLDDLREEGFERFARLAGELRYSTLPRLLEGVEGQLHRLTSRSAPSPEQLPTDLWTYLPAEGHFDYRTRATRVLDKSFFRRDISTIEIVDHLLSHDSVMTYSDVLVTVEYEPPT